MPALQHNHIHIHIHIHTHTHTHTHTHINTHRTLAMHDTTPHTHTHEPTHTCTHTHINTHTCWAMCMPICMPSWWPNCICWCDCWLKPGAPPTASAETWEICQMRPVNMKRDLYKWKETYVDEKRRMYMKRDVCKFWLNPGGHPPASVEVWEMCQKKPINIKGDLNEKTLKLTDTEQDKSKKTYVHCDWTQEVILLLVLSTWHEACNTLPHTLQQTATQSATHCNTQIYRTWWQWRRHWSLLCNWLLRHWCRVCSLLLPLLPLLVPLSSILCHVRVCQCSCVSCLACTFMSSYIYIYVYIYIYIYI